jgi:hypothetical protein
MHKVTDPAKPRISTPPDLPPRVLPPINGSGGLGESSVAISKSIELLPPGTPNSEPQTKGILRHVSLLRSTAQIDLGKSPIAISKRLDPCLVNPRMSIPRSPMGFDPSSPELPAISCATLPRSDGPRDFGFLLDNS